MSGLPEGFEPVADLPDGFEPLPDGFEPIGQRDIRSLAKKRLEALTGGASEDAATAPAAPGYKESAFPVTAQPAAPARQRPVPKPEPEGTSVLDAVLTPELQAARKRFAAARLSGSSAPNQPAGASEQRLRAGGLDVFASPKPPDEPYDPRQEGVHRVGDVATGFGAAVSEAFGGWGKLSPDATPIQRARLRRPEGLNLAGGGVRKYEPPAKDEPYLPLGAGVRLYRPTADRAAERLAALERGDDGTVRREAPQPLFAGKGLGEAPETTRLDLENPVGRTPAQFLRGTAPGRALENDYTKVHDWAQGAADDFGEWATKDTEHSSVARLIAAGENSDSALAQVLAAGTKGAIQAGASSAPALAEFAILHRATPGALKPLVDAAMASYFSGKEGVGQILEGAPALGTDIGSAFGGAPVPFEQMAQDFGKVGMGGFMAAGGAMASTPGTAAHDFITAGGRERADLARQLPGYADREMAARANSVEEMNPMIGALQRQPGTAALTDFLFNRGESGKQPDGTSFLDRPKMRGGPWQNGLADLFPAEADAGEAQFNPDYVRMAESHGPPISPYTNPRRGEYSDQMPPPSARGTGIYARDVPIPPGEVPPRPGQPTPEQLKAMLDSILGPSVEGTRQGPFPVPPDISQGRTLPPGPPLPEGATWQERQEAARREPAPPEPPTPPPPPPSMPPRYAPPEIPPDATWQRAQAVERGRRANPLEDPAKLKEILSNLLGPEAPQELEARTGRTPPAAEKIQPEPQATLDAQMQALVEGRKPAVLFPRQGEHAVPETPEGFVRVDTPAGAVIFDPNKVDAAAVAKAADSGKGLGKILGMGVDERPEGGTIVTARTPEGTEVQSAQATPEQVPAAVEAARKVAGPEGKVTEGTTEQIIADRQAGIEAEKKAATQQRIATENLPDYAREAIETNSIIRSSPKDTRLSPGGGRQRGKDPFAGARWVERDVAIAEITANPRNAKLGTDRHPYHEPQTDGPIVVDDRGEVLDGNNRVHRAALAGDKTIRAYVFDGPGDRYEPAAPEPVEAPAAEMPKGKPARVWVSPTEPLDVEYKIVEGKTVRTSHDKRTGEPNPDFGESQPRKRDKSHYLKQQADIAREMNPEFLMEDAKADSGAPVTAPPGPDGVRDVRHGNGRKNAIDIAYEDGTAEPYRQRLIADAAKYGETPESVAAMESPVLIREQKTEHTAEKEAVLANASNKGAAARMGVAEQAAVDAQQMTPELLSQFAPSESGDIMASSNRPFLRGFFSDIADSGDMVDRAGNVSAAGVARVKAAILAKAYGETSVLERALEAADDNTRNVSAGLLSAAPRVAKVRAMSENGELHPVDFTTPIKEAVDHLAHARDAGASIPDYLDQQDLFGDQISPEGKEILSFLDKNKRSPKKIAGFIDALARAVETAGHPDQAGLFGGIPDAPTLADILEAGRRSYEAKFGESPQGDLFAEPTGGGVAAGPDGPPGGRGGGASGGGGGGEPGGGGKPRVFSYSSSTGKGVGRDPYAERTGRQKVPVPSFKRLPRTPPVRPPEGPLEVLKVESLAPAYAKLKDGHQTFLRDLHEFFSATTMDDPAKVVTAIKRGAKAERAFQIARLSNAVRDMERYFDRLPPQDRMKATEEFGMAGEERRKQLTPELQAHWDLYHALTETAYQEMQRYGHDKFAGYVKDKDYFARQFVNEGAATAFAHEWYDRRSPDGPKGFLKTRYYELLRDALDSGLKLKHDNPARALIEYQAGVQQFLEWQKETSRSIRAVIRRYLPIDQPNPDGWDQIHPERGLVYGDPSVEVGEAVTKRHRLMEEIAKDLNIKVDRLPGVGGEFGRAEIGGPDNVRTAVVRAGTPVGILAHEIGHILDSDFHIWDEMTGNKDASPAVRTELRDLAALRYESTAGTVSQGYKDYVHTKEEQIANMLDAYVAEPNLFKAVAPVALGEFRSFLSKHPELHKFFEMEPGGKAAGLELEERVHRIPVKGKVVVGKWVSPRSVVKLIDRDLTKGFQDKLAYKSLRNLTNAMNKIQLGFSGFHGVFTGLDAVTGNLALALQQAVAATQEQHAGKGFGLDAAKSLAKMAAFPIIPFERYAEGKRIQKLAASLPRDTPFESMPPVVQQYLKAGGRFWEDSEHSANQVRQFRIALDRSNPFGAAFHLPGAVVEKLSSLIMEKWVPRIKIGMFAQEAAFEMKRLGADATDAEIGYHLGRVQESVENRFGQLAYENLLWHRAVKDIGQVVVRSLGWNLGDIRELVGGVFDMGRIGTRSVRNREVEAQKVIARSVIKNAEKDLATAQQGGKQAEIEKAEARLKRAQAAMPSNLNDPVFTRRMAYSLALPLSVGMMGAIYHWAKRGKLPANIKDAFAIPTGGRNKDGSEERVFLPTYAKDAYAWSTHPLETALHKLSPALATGAEIAKNQDYFGTQVREGGFGEQVKDSVEHGIRSLVPISIRQLMQSDFPGSALGKTEAGLGITKASASLSRSDAEEAINAYLRRTSGGVKTKAEAAKAKTHSEIKALLRGGHEEAADAAIERAIAEHQVAPGPEGRNGLYKAAAMTGQENTLRSMPVEEALGVMRKATPEERKRWAEAFRARMYGSSPSRRPAWWREKGEEQRQAILDEADKYLPAE